MFQKTLNVSEVFINRNGDSDDMVQSYDADKNWMEND